MIPLTRQDVNQLCHLVNDDIRARATILFAMVEIVLDLNCQTETGSASAQDIAGYAVSDIDTFACRHIRSPGGIMEDRRIGLSATILARQHNRIEVMLQAVLLKVGGYHAPADDIADNAHF